MSQHGQTEYWQDVSTFMEIREKSAAFYNAFPTGDGRKAKFKEAYLDYIEKNMEAFHPKLQTMLKIYFNNDTLKVVD
jgi:5-bromo-4-chloroindolyl phosphate hydrolysis protein